MEYNGSYQLGTLAGEVKGKWANGFRLKPYKGHMPANPFPGNTEPEDPENRHEEELAPTEAASDNRHKEVPVPARTDPDNPVGTNK